MRGEPIRREELIAVIIAPTFDDLSEPEQVALTEELLWWEELQQAQERIDQRWEDEALERAIAFGDHQTARHLIGKRRQRERSV